jgi:hypothetical protein
MSRSYRDNKRRVDHIHGIAWKVNYYGRHLKRSDSPDNWANWGNKPQWSIVRYSQGRRQFYAGLKRMKRHLLKNYRMHDRIYGHHMVEVV